MCWRKISIGCILLHVICQLMQQHRLHPTYITSKRKHRVVAQFSLLLLMYIIISCRIYVCVCVLVSFSMDGSVLVDRSRATIAHTHISTLQPDHTIFFRTAHSANDILYIFPRIVVSTSLHIDVFRGSEERPSVEQRYLVLDTFHLYITHRN